MVNDININLDINKALDQTVAPIFQRANKTIISLWNLTFGQIDNLNEKVEIKRALDLEAFKNSLSEKVNSIPEDKFKEPDVSIIGPSLENSKYYYNEEELREMFANLISSNMNIDKNNHVHTSFSDIIKQMTSYDANILKIISYPSIFHKTIANYIVKYDKGGQIKVSSNLHIASGEESFDRTSASLINLERLGLIKLHFDEWFSEESIYEPYFHTNVYNSLINQYNNDSAKMDVSKGIIEITAFGNDFIKVCF